MPVLRSQRSKPSKRRDEEEEMPPPPTTPPVTRTTRGKKVSKKEVPAVPKSPTPSTTSSRSTRSTRTKTRAKAAEEVEEIAVASPPSTRSTRSTRQKAGTSKAAAAKKEEKKKPPIVVPPELDPTVQLTPLVVAAKSRVKKTASKRGRPKKEIIPVESSTDDITEEESDIDCRTEQEISAEQLSKQHLVPFKTALESGFCENFTNYMAKAMDKTTEEKQEKRFQELMNCTEMPPPAAPAPKAKGKKGRQKRARSPENSPTKTTKVPESFNFADNNDCQFQAKKKMIIDQPTPEQKKVVPPVEPKGKEDLTEKMEEAATSIPASVPENEADKKKVAAAEEDADMFEHSVVDLADDSIMMEDEIEIAPIASKSEATARAEIPNKEKNSKADVVVKSKADSKGETAASTKAKIVETIPKAKTGLKAEVIPKTKADSKLEAVSKTKADSKLEAVSKTKADSKLELEVVPKTKADSKHEVAAKTKADAKPEVASKTKMASKVEEQSVKMDTEASQEKAAVAPEKKAATLDETYVFDTPKDKEPKLNTTYTPELFPDTPKSRAADQTIVISQQNIDKSKEQPEQQVLAPPSPESDSEGSGNAATTSASGKVSSLVNFFDKNKKEAESNKEKASSSKTGKDEINMNITHSISPDRSEPVDKNSVPSNDLNSTYVLPPVKKAQVPSAMNVTVCVKKGSEDIETMTKQEMLKPIVPPPSFLPTGNSRFMHDSPASRTFVKEPPSLPVVVEEEDDSKDNAKSEKQNEKTRPAVNAKPAQKEKDKDKGKGASTSSSSSGSSMKSASSQPCLVPNKKLPTSASKLTPSYGSTGKLNEINKSKPLEEAEKRRLELLQQKIESSKKKNAEWVKKTEKNKLEEEKRLKEKMKVTQPLPSSASTILKKPVPMAIGKPAIEGAAGGTAITKPKFNFGPSATKMPGSTMLPPLAKNPFHKPQALPPPPPEAEMEDSFKSAANERSFLDQTVDGHLSSYDITVYEDLDEDLKHRENKTLPNWAADKDSLKVALFSMVYLSEYQNKLPGGFPKPDKNYKLFPNRHY